MQEHFNRIVVASEKPDVATLMNEFIDSEIRSVSMKGGPGKGSKVINESRMQSFNGEATPDSSILVGKIHGARFIDSNTIFACGKFVVMS